MTAPAAYLVLSLACGAMQVLLFMKLRPDTHRLAALKPTVVDCVSAPRVFGFERVGRTILRGISGRRSRRMEDVGAVTATSVGAAAVFGTGLLPLGPVAAGAGALAGWIAPRLIDRRGAKARAAALVDDLPEVVDLLVLALGAGLNVPLAVDAVGRRGTGPLAAEMAVAAEATRRGQRLADALDDTAVRCGERVRPLMSLLASGERYGVPLGESLDRLAVDVRGARRRQAEEAARRLPVKMLFPLIVCILPAFALLTLGPLLLTSLGDLAW